MTFRHSPVRFWRCPNCGQVHFGDIPPDMCDFCCDFTTWKPLDSTHPAFPPAPVDVSDDDAAQMDTSRSDDDEDESGTYQPPLFDA